jgi:hypothetical protein
MPEVEFTELIPAPVVQYDHVRDVQSAVISGSLQEATTRLNKPVVPRIWPPKKPKIPIW